MNEEEKKAQEAVEAEAAAQAAAEAEAAKGSSTEEVDYKALAEAEKARADAAEEARLAAEALIVKNKAIAKRTENKDGEQPTLTEEKVLEMIKLATAKEDESPEAKALEEANKKVAEAKAKLAEIARAQKAKELARSDTAGTHFDGQLGTEPKLPDNSPLKTFKYEGNGIYSLKLASGKTMFKNTKPGPGQASSWIA
jgi:hypothetical protein